MACQHGDLESINKMIATAAADVETPDDSNHWTPIFVAALYGHQGTTQSPTFPHPPDIVERLLEESVDVEAKDKLFEWTPIHASVWNGHADRKSVV